MKKYLKNKNDQAGFTLIEILVGLILISLICISVIPLFTNSFKGITSSAVMSKKNYEGQEAMENILAGETYSEISGSTQTYSPMTIKFPGVTDMVVKGNVVTTPITYNSQVDNLTSFIPQ
jgi:prepilin-type N-terminal cleavage/methylation domain-containing protein